MHDAVFALTLIASTLESIDGDRCKAEIIQFIRDVAVKIDEGYYDNSRPQQRICKEHGFIFLDNYRQNRPISGFRKRKEAAK